MSSVCKFATSTLLAEVRKPLLNQQTEIIRTKRMLIRRQLNQFLSQQHLGVRWKLDLKGGGTTESNKKKF